MVKYKFQSFLNKNPHIKDLAKVFIWYGSLHIFLYIYIGLSLPGGKLDFPLFYQYNLLIFFEYLITQSTYWILFLFDHSVTIYNHNIIGINNEFYVRILHGCLGLYIMVAYIALMLGTSGRKKSLWIVIGLFFIHIINVLRICILLLFHNNIPGLSYKIHDWVNLLGYSLIFTLYYVWFKRYATK